jgi:lysophospholipase L1-like esterase
VLTGAITPDETCREGYFKSSTLTISRALENFEKFTARMRRLTDEENVEFLDMRSAWNDYVLRSPRPIEWFQRDRIHGNSRGKQVVGRILLRYFEPQ